MKLVVAVSGASGAPYAKRLLDFLADEGPRHGVSGWCTASVAILFVTVSRRIWSSGAWICARSRSCWDTRAWRRR